MIYKKLPTTINTIKIITVTTLLSISSLTFATLKKEVVSPILNIEELQKSNAVAKETGSYNLYKDSLNFIENHKELTLEDQRYLSNRLESLKNYVLYPILLAKVISNYPDNFPINLYSDYFITYFPYANFTQSAFNSSWLKDIEINNYTNIINDFYKIHSNISSRCAYEVASINSFIDLQPLRSATLLNDVLSYSNISNTCQYFISSFFDKITLTKYNKVAVEKFIIKQSKLSNKEQLYLLGDLTKYNKELANLQQYAINLIDNPSYIFENGVYTGAYKELSYIAAYKVAHKNRYKEEKDFQEFYNQILNSQLDKSIKKYAIAQYLEYNYYRLPSDITDIFVSKYPTDKTLENKVREAILNKKPYIQLINLMSVTNRNSTEWLYWRARSIEKTSPNEARKIYLDLINKQGFYGLLSSQKLKRRYNFVYKNISKIDTPYDLNSNLPWLATAIKEANDNGDTTLANTLWSTIKVNKEYTGLISWAYINNYYYLGVYSSIRQGLRENLRARFPDAYAKTFYKLSKNKTVTKTFAQAIARQESAWNYAAISRAPAYGLMQFINSTAKVTAGKIGINYSGPEDLFVPQTSIQLGTYHLSELLDNNSNNRALTAIGYNAGPARINQWLSRSNGELDFDEFVATIPFSETRNYVMNTITYDYYNQVLQGYKKPIAIYPNEWNRKY